MFFIGGETPGQGPAHSYERRIELRPHGHYGVPAIAAPNEPPAGQPSITLFLRTPGTRGLQGPANTIDVRVNQEASALLPVIQPGLMRSDRRQVALRRLEIDESNGLRVRGRSQHPGAIDQT